MLTVWDDIFATRAWGRWPAEEAVRAVASLGAGARLRILEIGSGAGAQLWYAEHEGHVAVGVDRSRVGAQRALERLREECLPTRVAVADALALPLADSSFDVVLDVEALAYIGEDETAAAWHEVARVLRPASHFVSIAFTPLTYAWSDGEGTARRIGSRSVDAITSGPLAGTGRTAFLDEATARGLAAEVGLDVVDLQRRGRTAGPSRVWIDELVLTARTPA
ncbi:MAG TPA: class I SAM-dependent methyltransferase [Acidimicrobiia bacterium]|jgi:SAM-dependent methyltransferase